MKLEGDSSSLIQDLNVGGSWILRPSCGYGQQTLALACQSSWELELMAVGSGSWVYWGREDGYHVIPGVSTRCKRCNRLLSERIRVEKIVFLYLRETSMYCPLSVSLLIHPALASPVERLLVGLDR